MPRNATGCADLGGFQASFAMRPAITPEPCASEAPIATQSKKKCLRPEAPPSCGGHRSFFSGRACRSRRLAGHNLRRSSFATLAKHPGS